MKEKLYTIPLNDAVNAGDECPFCYIERNVEQDLMDFVLGSCASYMESDVREDTDREGFCRAHMKKMFDYGNTLGNGWILKTHYKKLLAEMESRFSRLSRARHPWRTGSARPPSKIPSASGWKNGSPPAISATALRRITNGIWIPFFTFTKMIPRLWKRFKTARGSACTISGICATGRTAAFPIRKRKLFTP